MRLRLSAPVRLIVVAGAAILVCSATAPASEYSGPKQAADQAIQMRAQKRAGPEKVFVGPLPAAAETGLAKEAAELARQVYAFTAVNGEPEFLIALLPDPLESFAPDMFDLHLAAIDRALTGAGYLAVKRSLPWSLGARTAAGGKGGEEPIYHRRPGILFYTGGERTFIVLLVGETPTAGVHGAALHAAIGLAREHVAEGEPVLILGPTFSGSAPSLRRVLAEWSELEGVRFRVVSGSASHPKNKTLLAEFDYDSAATDVTLLMDVMFEHLRGLGIRCGEIAMLRESTFFGSAAEGEAPRGSCRPDELLNINYPVYISEIRRAYSELARKQAKPDAEQETRNLSVGLGDRRALASEARLFGDLTIQMQDMVLQRALRSLTRRRIRAVGIVSSNLKDSLFLAQEVHKHAPGVLLFTFEGQNLLAHPDFAAECRGALIASSHSLYWQYGPTAPFHFARDSQQGTFFAAKALLDGSRFPPERDVWLTVASRDGLTPVKLVSERPDSECGPLRSCAEPVDATRAYYLVVFLLVLLTGGAVAQALRDPPRALHAYRAGLGARVENRLATMRFWFSIAGCGLATVLLGLYLGPLLGLLLDWSLGSLARVLAGMAGTVGGWLGFRALRDRMGRPRATSGSSTYIFPQWRRGLATLATLAGLLAGTLANLSWFGGPDELPFAAARALDLSSGVAPLTPLSLLLCVPLGWVMHWVYVLRKAEGEDFWVSARLLPKRWGRYGAWMAAAIFVPLLAASFLSGRYTFVGLRSIESPAFDGLVTTLFFIAVVIVADAAYRTLFEQYQLGRLVATRSAPRHDNKTTRYAVRRVEGFLAITAAGLLLIFLAVSLYPFEPAAEVRRYVGLLLLGAVALTGYVARTLGAKEVAERLGAGAQFRLSSTAQLAAQQVVLVVTAGSSLSSGFGNVVGTGLDYLWKAFN